MKDIIRNGISKHESDEGILDRRTNKKYPTALRAMIETESFHDLVGYTSLSLPKDASDEPLLELYKKRLMDLRKENEYLELWWGGGYDSTMILYVSMLTGIEFDNIVMYCNGNPKTYKGGMNYELFSNYRHILHYEDFWDITPGNNIGEKIHHLDIFKMWDIVKTQYHDYELWCSAAYGCLDDISRIAADDLMRESRAGRQGTIITGKGYGGVVYNQDLDTWSYYSESLNMNYPGATSNELPVTRFFRTPEIIRSTAEKARTWFHENKPAFKGIWATTEEWDHAHHRYPELLGQIEHLGKDLDWQDHPKTAGWRSDIDTKQRFPEYWNFVDWLDTKIPKDCFRQQSTFADRGIENPEPHVIDF